MNKQIQGFKPITIHFSDDFTTKHTMFMKEHSIRNQSADLPIGKTLYLINVPPWADENSIQKAFNLHAPVTSVTFHKIKDTTHTGYKSAYIVFSTEKALYKALTITSLGAISTSTEPVVTGLQKWVMEYNRSLNDQFNQEQEMLAIIKSYDAEETKRKLKEKGVETDDEGWTVVTKKGRNPGLSRKESVAEKLMAKSKKGKVLKNFYRHQIRQAKRDQLATLRKKAEEDKKKILALKQRRAFNPF